VTDTITARTDNWGRWGEDDERGALNLLTPDAVLAATKACRTGKVYSLSLPIQQHGVPIVDYRNPPMRLTLVNSSDKDIFAEFGGVDTGANEDFLVLASHSLTHMDALCHVFHEGRMYNGFPAESAQTRAGALHCGIQDPLHRGAGCGRRPAGAPGRRPPRRAARHHRHRARPLHPRPGHRAAGR
jgi:hypothetical protein